MHNTSLDYLNWATIYLEEHNIASARHNAEELLSHVWGKPRLEIYLEAKEILDDFKTETFISLVRKRAEGYPLQYLVGRVEFFGLNFWVSEATFIPRPETEILVEKVIEMAKLLDGLTVRLLDVGTGCGNIAISLAKFISDAQVTATDISSGAIKMAQYNARLNNVADKIKFVQSDLFTSYELEVRGYDIIVSNPPYVAQEDFKDLAAELFHEPRIALDGKEDGLFYIRKLIRESPNYLRKDGVLAMEIGFDQALAVRKFFEHSSYFKRIEIVKDYQGIDRVVILYRERN